MSSGLNLNFNFGESSQNTMDMLENPTMEWKTLSLFSPMTPVGADDWILPHSAESTRTPATPTQPQHGMTFTNAVQDTRGLYESAATTTSTMPAPAAPATPRIQLPSQVPQYTVQQQQQQAQQQPAQVQQHHAPLLQVQSNSSSPIQQQQQQPSVSQLLNEQIQLIQQQAMLKPESEMQVPLSTLEFVNKLVQIQKLQIIKQEQDIQLQRLRMEQERLKAQKVPEEELVSTHIPPSQVIYDESAGSESEEEEEDDEYIPDSFGAAGNKRRGSVVGDSLRRNSYSSPSMPSPSRNNIRQQQQQLALLAQQQQQQQQMLSSSVPVVMKQANPNSPYILVRGARKSNWDRLDTMTVLNSKPYKYCLRIVFPYRPEQKNTSPFYRIQAEDIGIRILSIDKDNQNKECIVADGVVLEKVMKTNTTQTGKEIDIRVCLMCYSHGFNRQGFCIEIMDTSENVILYRSNEFKIFARRKRNSSSGGAPSGKKRKTSHPGK